MKSFKRKSLAAAVVAGLGALASGTAGAVNLSPDGTGQVLLYPYYTVRNNFVTSVSVVNTSQVQTKAVKVRFIEGKNSAEVLDFNVYLSPRDVWSGSVSQTTDGARITTTDTSCTIPAIPAAGQPFTNLYYMGAAVNPAADARYDGGGTSLDRVREGYIEMIEMGVVEPTYVPTPLTTGANTKTLVSLVKHLEATNAPSGCAAIQVNGLHNTAAIGGAIQFGTQTSGITTPLGGLAGSGIIIDVANGTEFVYNPVVLQNFRGIGTAAIYTDSGSTVPNLNQVSPATSIVFNPTTGAVLTDNFVALTNAPVDAVSAVLMASTVLNEYEVGDDISARTDWVITMPTKRFYAFNDTAANRALTPAFGALGAATGNAHAPFTVPFSSRTAGTTNHSAAFTNPSGYPTATVNASACETIFFQNYNREEAPYATAPQQQGVLFSPIPAGAPSGNPFIGALCWESTVVTMRRNGVAVADAQIFNSANSADIQLPAVAGVTNYRRGWVSITPAGLQSGQPLITATVSPFVTGTTSTVTINGTIFPLAQNEVWPFDATVTGAVVGNGPAGGIPNFAVAGVLNTQGLVGSANTHRGLPMIGFAAVRAPAATNAGQVAGTFTNRYIRRVN